MFAAKVFLGLSVAVDGSAWNRTSGVISNFNKYQAGSMLKKITRITIPILIIFVGVKFYYHSSLVPNQSIIESEPEKSAFVAPVNSPVHDAPLTQSNHSSVAKNTNLLLSEQYQKINKNSAYPTLDSRMDALLERRPNTNISKELLLQNLAEASAWKSSNRIVEDTSHGIDSNQSASKKYVVEFNRGKIETLMNGDTLEIPIPETGNSYVMRVDNIQANGDGNITWSGVLLNENGGDYPVTFTQNQATLTVGGVSTPTGHFGLEARESEGWLMASRVMTRAHGDKPDFIIPKE